MVEDLEAHGLGTDAQDLAGLHEQGGVDVRLEWFAGREGGHAVRGVGSPLLRTAHHRFALQVVCGLRSVVCSLQSEFRE